MRGDVTGRGQCRSEAADVNGARRRLWLAPGCPGLPLLLDPLRQSGDGDAQDVDREPVECHVAAGLEHVAAAGSW